MQIWGCEGHQDVNTEPGGDLKRSPHRAPTPRHDCTGAMCGGGCRDGRHRQPSSSSFGAGEQIKSAARTARWVSGRYLMKPRPSHRAASVLFAVGEVSRAGCGEPGASNTSCPRRGSRGWSCFGSKFTLRAAPGPGGERCRAPAGMGGRVISALPSFLEEERLSPGLLLGVGNPRFRPKAGLGSSSQEKSAGQLS